MHLLHLFFGAVRWAGRYQRPGFYSWHSARPIHS